MKRLIIITLLLNATYLKAKCIPTNEKLQGRGVLTFSWFKIKLYEIGYFKEKNRETLALHFKKDISSYYLNQGWDEGLKEFTSIESDKFAIDWLKSKSPDAKESDCIKYYKYKDGKTEVVYNGKTIANTRNKSVSKLVLYPWIGENSVDEELKTKLIGQK